MARMSERRNEYRVVMRKPEGKEAGCCEHGDELSDSIKYGLFLD